MAETNLIGASAFVRGNVRGEGNVEIEGRVEGDVDVRGVVTVQQGALIKASIRAERVIVRGAVAGDVFAVQAVLLEEGARVVGLIQSPSVGISDGALLRGRVETAPPGARTEPRTTATAAARGGQQRATAPATARASTAATAVRAAELPRGRDHVAPVAARAVPARAAAPATTRPGAPVRAESAYEGEDEGDGDGAATNVRPPAPVMPSLKRGAKAVLRKKAGA